MFGTSALRRLSRELLRELAVLPWLLVAATAAHAQPRGLQLEVSADAQGCVSEPSLRARLERFLRVHRPIDVEVVVHAGAQPVAFELRHDGVFAAERRFDVLPTGCSARLDALALAIAVAVEHTVGPERASLDPSAATREPAEPVATPTETPTSTPESKPGEAAAAEAERPPAAKPPDAPPSEAPAEPSGPPLVLTAAPFVGGGVLIEALPEAALALHGGAELRLGPTFAVSFAGLFVPRVVVELGEARAGSSLLGARALGCAGSSPRGLRFEGCVGAVGGVVWASGQKGALQHRSDDSMGWVAAALRAAASYPADGTFGVRLALDGHLNAVRPGLRVLPEQPDPPAPSLKPIKRISGRLGGAASIEVWLALP